MKILISRHPLAIRWFHWINFPVLFIMIWSGLMIYWANDIYQVRINGHTFIQFFPDSFYKAFNLPYHLALGMSWHFVFMWVFFLNGLFYVCYTIFSGEWRLLVPEKKSFREAWQVLLHDLFLRKTVPEKDKYNGTQRIAYTLIVLMGIGSLLTGLAIYKPFLFPTLTALLGGYEAARLEHFCLTIGFVIFFIIHLVQVIRTGWNNFRAIITGWEVAEYKGAEGTDKLKSQGHGEKSTD